MASKKEEKKVIAEKIIYTIYNQVFEAESIKDAIAQYEQKNKKVDKKS